MKPTKCSRCDAIVMAWPYRSATACCKDCLRAVKSANGRRRADGQAPAVGAVKLRKLRGTVYRIAYRPDHPDAPKSGWMMEHRLVMEQHLGRRLSATEVVHHVDHDGLNNSIGNLMLCESRGAHLAEHHASDAGRASASSRPLCSTCGNRTEHARQVCWPCEAKSGSCGECRRDGRKLAKPGVCHGCYKRQRMARRAG